MKKSQFPKILNRNSRPVWLLAIGAWPSFRSIMATRSILLGAIFFVIFFIAPFSASAATINKPSNLFNLKNGLVGYWTFDGKDMLNGTVLDKSGNYATGTPFNIATSTFYTAGKIGQGFRFDGVNDYVEVLDTDTILDYVASSTYAWSSWIKFTGSTSGYKCFLSKDGPAKQSGFNLCINQTASLADVVICKYVTGPTWSCSSGLSLNIPSGGWNHITVNYDGSLGNWAIYKNGSSMGTINFYTSSDNVFKYYIGSGNNGSNNPQGPAYYWNGQLDDVRIYNRALNPAEIKQLYNMGR